MRLVVEEAQDHCSCMEKLRNLYGADCVVVHSFRVDDRYRVVIAVETEMRSRNLPHTSVVKDVVSNRQILWDTLIGDDLAPLSQPVPNETASDNHKAHQSTAPQALPEISSGLVELAARIKALEGHEPATILEPESNEFRAAVFSDVLAAAVATSSDTQTAATAYPASRMAESMHNTGETATPVSRVTTFPTPVEALVSSRSGSTRDASTEILPEEAPIPRVCTSDSAENFASLLLGCVADSRKTLPLSEPSRLRMVAS